MRTSAKVYFAFTLFLCVLTIGTLGYMLIEGTDPLTALYMTIITAAAVGFREVIDLHPAGQVFTMLIILAGLSTWTFVTVTLTAFLIEGEFRKMWLHAKIRKRIRRMENHFIICGYGQTGRSALDEFLAVDAPVVVIENKENVVEELQEDYPDLLVIHGDARDDDHLLEAGAPRARGLIAATETDADNLFIVLSARNMNPDMVITTRANQFASYDKLRHAGATHVVLPNVTGGLRMASTLLRPDVVDFLDVMMRGTGETIRVEQVRIPKGAALVGQKLFEAEIPKKTGLLVMAIRHADGRYTFNPSSNIEFTINDVLIVIGKQEQISELHRMLQH